MALTKQQLAANARAAKAAKLEAAADVSAPEPRDLQAEAEKGYAEVAGIEPTTYRYIGGLGAVIVEVDGTNYEFRTGELVHLAHPVKGLDENTDFERVGDEAK